MTSLVRAPGHSDRHTPVRPVSSGAAAAVARPRPVIGPAWWSAVLGTATGVLAPHAVAAVPGLPAGVSESLGLLARAMVPVVLVVLAGVLALSVAQWWREPAAARLAWADPQQGQAAGALPMALMAVATAVLVGGPGAWTAPWVTAGAVGCWAVGAVLAVVVAIAVPRRTWRGTESDVTGTWLMPVVAPMVAAATAPALLPVLPTVLPAGLADAVVVPLLVGGLACGVLAGVLALRVVARLRLRLRWRAFPAAAVPTLWVVLGPCGQAATAAHTLSAAAATHWPDAATPLTLLGALLAVPPLVLGLAWLAVLLRLTPGMRRRVPASAGLSWWALTFPVGTLVTGAAGLATATGVLAPAVLALALLAVVAAGWVVAARASVALLRSGVESSASPGRTES